MSESIARPRSSLSESMRDCGAVAKAVLADDALNQKTRDLKALAIDCIVRCNGYISLHTHAARRADAACEEIAEAFGVAEP